MVSFTVQLIIGGHISTEGNTYVDSTVIGVSNGEIVRFTS